MVGKMDGDVDASVPAGQCDVGGSTVQSRHGTHTLSIDSTNVIEAVVSTGLC
jgi:hypothetical protein